MLQGSLRDDHAEIGSSLRGQLVMRAGAGAVPLRDHFAGIARQYSLLIVDASPWGRMQGT